MFLIKNNKLSILSSKLSILSNKLSILSKKLIISSNKLSIISSKLCILVQAILVQAILVQRYSCAPNILYYINHSIIWSGAHRARGARGDRVCQGIAVCCAAVCGAERLSGGS